MCISNHYIVLIFSSFYLFFFGCCQLVSFFFFFLSINRVKYVIYVNLDFSPYYNPCTKLNDPFPISMSFVHNASKKKNCHSFLVVTVELNSYAFFILFCYLVFEQCYIFLIILLYILLLHYKVNNK